MKDRSSMSNLMRLGQRKLAHNMDGDSLIIFPLSLRTNLDMIQKGDKNLEPTFQSAISL